MASDEITFGWFLPTFGDTTAFGDPKARIEAGRPLFDDVVQAADEGGFNYLLMPVAPTCWEATTLGAYYLARTKRLSMLVAVRAAYVNPTQAAKSFATLDQLSGGRISINLIAGISDHDTLADGIPDSKAVRYEKMDEEVSIMKALWTNDQAIDFKGKHYHVTQVIEPKPLQKPHPPFFLGGGSAEAAEVSAKHSAVHLFWGDKPDTIGTSIARIRGLAAKYGRADAIQFGMRLHVICRDSTDEAWAAARKLIEGAPRLQELQDIKWGKAGIESIAKTSVANQKMWELLEKSDKDLKIHPHLWTGISSVRPGAGLAVVGTPKEIANTLEEFIAAGCTSFCFSGYPHAEAARTFSQKIMPLFKGRHVAGLPRAA